MIRLSGVGVGESTGVAVGTSGVTVGFTIGRRVTVGAAVGGSDVGKAAHAAIRIATPVKLNTLIKRELDMNMLLHQNERDYSIGR
jgi:hypothetical protein